MEWCSHHNLELTKEMVVDFRRKGLVSQPLAINGVEVERVGSFRFLGTIVAMKGGDNLSCITKKSPPKALFYPAAEKIRGGL